jgi:hypothetical protein
MAVQVKIPVKYKQVFEEILKKVYSYEKANSKHYVQFKENGKVYTYSGSLVKLALTLGIHNAVELTISDQRHIRTKYQPSKAEVIDGFTKFMVGKEFSEMSKHIFYSIPENIHWDIDYVMSLNIDFQEIYDLDVLVERHSLLIYSTETGKEKGYTYIDDDFLINHSCLWTSARSAVLAGIAAGRITKTNSGEF